MKTNFLFVAIVVLLFGCGTKNESPNCLAVINILELKFNIIDKTSQKDLFFDQNAVYKESDLKIYKSTDTNHEKPLQVVVQSSQGRKYFSVRLSDDLKQGSLDIVVETLAKDQLEYNASLVNNPCPEYTLSEVKFNKTNVLPKNGIYALIK